MRLMLVASILTTLATGCGKSGHQRMLALLQEIVGQRSESDYFGDSTAVRLREQLAELPPDATDIERYDLNVTLSERELWLGHTKEAVHRLLEAQRSFERMQDPISRRCQHTYEFRTGFFNDNLDALTLRLGVAYLRLAEDENCVHCRTGESCILPLRHGGIHQHQNAARNAITCFEKLLNRQSDDLTARWLLNIGAMAVGEYPHGVSEQHLIPPSAFESTEEFPEFVNVAADLGLDIITLSGGVIADDFDDDGLLDIVVSNWDLAGQLRYFRNGGAGTFSEQTSEAGFTGLTGGLNLIQADYDNDGDTDILVLRGAWLGESGRHPNSLLRNDGAGRFEDVTFEAGLGEVHFPTQTAAWADYDNDGDLDLYMGNENHPCQLFDNNGRGVFTDVAERAGVENGSYTKGVVWGDYNNDRYPDLYVSNLSGVNRLYLNHGDGTFSDVAARLGVTRPVNGFPVWFWDFNNDGNLDLFASSFQFQMDDIVADYLALPHKVEADCLYQGDGQGFREVAAEQNLNRVTLPMGANFGDLDNDGYPDFYLGTGFFPYKALIPNLLFHNQQGRGFSDVTTASRMGHLQKGHGVAFADLDNDGDQDVFIELGGAYRGDAFANALFENPGFGAHWITVKLVGTRSNRSAIGARIRVEIEKNGSKRSIYKWVNSGGSFGANPLRREIGLGQATQIEVLEVFWPATGRTQRFHNVQADQTIEITEGQPEFRRRPQKRFEFRTQAAVSGVTDERLLSSGQ